MKGKESFKAGEKIEGSVIIFFPKMLEDLQLFIELIGVEEGNDTVDSGYGHFGNSNTHQFYIQRTLVPVHKESLITWEECIKF